MKLKLFVLALLCLAPIFLFAQTKKILLDDLDQTTQDLTEEQLARLVNYAVKLRDEPIKAKKKNHKLQKPKADVVWINSKYELSNITKGDILFLPFQHTNFSDTPYVIDNIQSNCNCVTAQKPTEPLLKNESYTLMLSIDTGKIQDSKGITILLHDNSSPTGKTYLFVNADILEPATARH